MQEKLKSLAQSEQTFYAVLLCLIGIIAFVLGRYSVLPPEISIMPAIISEQNQAGVVFIDAPAAEPVLDAVQVVASSGGTRYHLLTCSGAKSIKEANKIYFDSIEQAKAAGYTPAANCSF